LANAHISGERFLFYPAQFPDSADLSADMVFEGLADVSICSNVNFCMGKNNALSGKIPIVWVSYRLGLLLICSKRSQKPPDERTD